MANPVAKTGSELALDLGGGAIRVGQVQDTSGNVVGGVSQQAAIADLAQDISATYVEAEVQAISTKVDAILAALRSAGMVAD